MHRAASPRQAGTQGSNMPFAEGCYTPESPNIVHPMCTETDTSPFATTFATTDDHDLERLQQGLGHVPSRVDEGVPTWH